MTNAHVVEGASEVLVTLPDKREFKAKIIGADKRTDVAVVKIDATGLPAVKVGDVSQAAVGEWVMAIGSPFGLENTVTAGIVSAKQRDTGDYLPFIQTDVAINPGNSGGPLINMRGEVVGINSQIYSRSGGFMGISFSIPIDEAIRVSDQLRTSRAASRAGASACRSTRSRRTWPSRSAWARRRARWCAASRAGSPGEKAGIEAGRHHHQVRRQGDREAQRPAAPGRQHQAGHARATLTVFRRGSSRDLNVTIAEIEPDKPAKRARRARRAGSQAVGLRGRQVAGPGGERPHRRAEEGAQAQGRREGRRRHRCAPRAPACARAT